MLWLDLFYVRLYAGEEMFAGVNVDIIVMTNPVPLEYFKSANWSVKCQNLLISGLICFF